MKFVNSTTIAGVLILLFLIPGVFTSIIRNLHHSSGGEVDQMADLHYALAPPGVQLANDAYLLNYGDGYERDPEYGARFWLVHSSEPMNVPGHLIDSIDLVSKDVDLITPFLKSRYIGKAVTSKRFSWNDQEFRYSAISVEAESGRYCLIKRIRLL